MLDVIVDVHYYSGGLHIARLGTDTSRPAWVPAPADRYVGFRDEAKLDGNTVAVEYARYYTDQGVASWLGLYRSARDAVFGDRANHAGVGVWLLERDLKFPTRLVAALRLLLEEFNESLPDALASDADLFATDYVPLCTVERRNLPPGLSGIPPSAEALPRTELCLAEGQDIGAALSSAANHLLLRSIVPPADPSSRVLVICAVVDAQASGGFPAAAIVGTDSFETLVAALPGILENVSDENEEARTLSARSRAELVSAKDHLKRSEEQVVELQAQILALSERIEENDVTRNLALIKRSLGQVESIVRGIEAKVSSVARQPSSPAYTIERDEAAQRQLHSRGSGILPGCSTLDLVIIFFLAFLLVGLATYFTCRLIGWV